MIGETGVGKSTLANIIYNEGFSEDHCTKPFKVGSTAASVTRASSMQYNSVTKNCVIDTVGVGDPVLDEQDILGNVRSLVRNTAQGVNAVVVVMRMARVPHAARANMYVLEKLFAPRDLRSHGVLVLTHWEGEIGDEDGDLTRWIGEDQEIKEMVSRFDKVILTNNQLRGKGADPDCREKCAKELLDFICGTTFKVKARPVNLTELVVDLFRKFGAFMWRRTLKVKDFMHKCGESGVPTFCGECPACYEDIKMEDSAHLPCNHSFHVECLRHQARCPICREAFCLEETFCLKDIFTLLET